LNVKVVIEVDGSSDEVEGWLSRFALSRNGTSVNAAIATPRDGLVWTSDLADQLVFRITDHARRALGFMAASAPEISFKEIQTLMNMDGVRMGGVLASFGFAERAGLPRPYRADRERRRYLMDVEVAEVILEAIERLET